MRTVTPLQELLRLVNGSGIGRLLWLSHTYDVCGEQILDVINQTINETMQAGTLIEEKLTVAKKSALDAIALRMPLDFLPPKRIVEVLYRGEKLRIEVQSIHEEIDLRFASMIRQVAIRDKVLELLFCESALIIGDKTVLPPGGVDPALVVRANAVRKRLARAVMTSGVESADGILAVVRKKKADALIVDPHGKLELTLLESMTGDASDERLVRKMVTVFPTVRDAISPETTLASLQGIKGSQLFKMSSKASQEKFKIVCDCVLAVTESRPPNFEATDADCKFMGKVIPLFEFFVRGVVKGGPGNKANVVVTGSRALEVFVEETHKKLDAKKEVTESERERLRTFCWLLPASCKSMAESILDSARLGGSMMPVKSAPSSSSGSMRGVASKKRKTDTAASSSMLLFTGE